MGSTTIQARHGEDVYPIGRFILDRARALGLSRTELLRRLGYVRSATAIKRSLNCSRLAQFRGRLYSISPTRSE
jgi:hypothetical protein